MSCVSVAQNVYEIQMSRDKSSCNWVSICRITCISAPMTPHVSCLAKLLRCLSRCIIQPFVRV